MGTGDPATRGHSGTRVPDPNRDTLEVDYHHLACSFGVGFWVWGRVGADGGTGRSVSSALGCPGISWARCGAQGPAALPPRWRQGHAHTHAPAGGLILRTPAPPLPLYTHTADRASSACRLPSWAQDSDPSPVQSTPPPDTTTRTHQVRVGLRPRPRHQAPLAAARHATFAAAGRCGPAPLSLHLNQATGARGQKRQCSGLAPPACKYIHTYVAVGGSPPVHAADMPHHLVVRHRPHCLALMPTQLPG